MAARVALIVVSLALVALTGEVVLRALHRPDADVLRADGSFRPASLRIHRASDDPVLVYELTPGSRATREGVAIEINADGFRDDPFPSPPPEDRARIVVVGDSVAWGWGVPMTDAFPQVLEARLAELTPADAPPPVVYNLSVDGYSTRQELRLLEGRGLALAPDLVIVAYVLNDPDVEDGGLSRYFRPRPASELLEAMRRGVARGRDLLVGATHPEPTGEYHQRIHDRHRELVARQFEELGALSRESGVPILVAVVPVFRFPAGGPYPWRNLHDRIAALCRANGLSFLDLYASFREIDAARVALGSWHPSIRGHRIIADALVSHLREHPGLWQRER